MICVSITAPNSGLAVEQIQKANEDADVIELRLDFLKEISEKDLEKMFKASKRPLLCTCRRLEEGGHFKGSEAERISILKKCMKLGSDYIDLEFETKKSAKESFFEYKKKNKLKSKIILSKHFFGHTPHLEELEKLLKKMVKEKPYVVKIVSKANSNEDNKIIFSLLKHAKHRGIKIISFCMGSIGRDSRILSMPLGSFLTFASLEKGDESADGQIPVKELKKIYSGLRVML